MVSTAFLFEEMCSTLKVLSTCYCLAFSATKRFTRSCDDRRRRTCKLCNSLPRKCSWDRVFL